jgi:hypothetical protein
MTSIEWLKKELEDYGSPSHLNLDWETFDELIEQAKEMHKQEMAQLPQQEISDEKILDAAEEHSDSFLNRGVAMSSFAGGCYWYREQLKKK